MRQTFERFRLIIPRIGNEEIKIVLPNKKKAGETSPGLGSLPNGKTEGTLSYGLKRWAQDFRTMNWSIGELSSSAQQTNTNPQQHEIIPALNC